ncbi:MSMEG_6728 family protein [Saccharothrix deserti]|uniref:MSMEG_6728 family protein n=1 Tax=Saccharothrix deserti TaxID=2593674 RepID=UPI00192E3265|nr:MSMEG_6728 family protein [Saccharothrix deserti]
MQTFLPRATFGRSAATLDTRRLGKQRVETLQILRALVWPEYGWKRHPAVLMWRGFTPALVAYGLAVCDEWRRRGHRDGTRAVLLPGPSVGRIPTEADMDAMLAEATDPRKVRFFRRGQPLPPPTSRFTLELDFGEKSSADVSIRRNPVRRSSKTTEKGS